jgi:hypothetical protein
MSVAISSCTELIHRALRMVGEEGLPLADSVAVPARDLIRFIVPDDVPPNAIDLFTLGLDLARNAMGISDRIQVQVVPRSVCEEARVMLSASPRGADDGSRECAINPRVAEWLVSDSRNLPLLEIIGPDTIDAREQLTRTLHAHGIEYRDGGLVYLPAPEAARLLREQPESEEAKAMKLCRCLVLQGLGEAESDWKVLIRHLALRAGFGKWTILMDRKEPEWLHNSYYGDMLRPATEVFFTSADGKSRSQEARGQAREEAAAADSDRELILVAASVVARSFGVNGQSLLNRRSNSDELKARQAAIFVVRKWKKFEFSLIGRVLGERTPVSAAQAYRRIEDRYKAEPEYARVIDAALHELNTWEQGLLQSP